LPDPLSRQRFDSFAADLDGRFGVRAARCLPIHVTLKGFFQTDMAEADVGALVARKLGDALPTLRTGPVRVYDGTSVCLRVGGDGEPRAALQTLHESILDAVRPAIAPECPFTAAEWSGPRYDPHITLANFDVEPTRVDAIASFAEERAPRVFVPGSVALLRVESADWSRWWQDVTLVTLATHRLRVTT